jgi:hypothetical protein
MPVILHSTTVSVFEAVREALLGPQRQLMINASVSWVWLPAVAFGSGRRHYP